MTIINPSQTPDILDVFNAYLTASLPASQCMRKVAIAFPKHEEVFNTMAENLASGKSLDSQLREFEVFPLEITELIISGSMSGRLEETIDQVIENQRIVNDLSDKTRKSLMTQCVTIAVAIIATPFMIVFMAGQSKDDSLIFLASKISNLMDIVPFLEFIYPFSILIGFISIFTLKEVQGFVIKLVSIIPYVRNAITNWQLGIWSNAMALSSKSGLTFSVAEPLLRSFLSGELREAIRLLNKDSLDKGWVKALEPSEWEEGDPRFNLSDIFITSLLSGASTGMFDKQLDKLSKRMLKDAQKSFGVITQISFYLIMFLAAGIVLYLSIAIMAARFDGLG